MRPIKGLSDFTAPAPILPTGRITRLRRSNLGVHGDCTLSRSCLGNAPVIPIGSFSSVACLSIAELLKVVNVIDGDA